METLCCLGKILYYVGLIVYMVCDSLFDGWNCFRLFLDNEDIKVDNFLFFSSVVGLIINFCLLRLYGHYIKFHWECFLDGYSECPYKDHFDFNRLELQLSVAELVLKDGIQSYIVFLIYASNLTGSRPGWYVIVLQPAASLRILSDAFASSRNYVNVVKAKRMRTKIHV